MADIIKFPRAIISAEHAAYEYRIRNLFAGRSRADVRRFWDQIGDDSFYHGPEGDFDCYLNMIGDGDYCAV